MERDDLLFKDEVYAIIGAAIEVHRVLGSGFLEAVYQEAMEIELAARQIPYEADLLGFEKIVVELKACECLTDEHMAQTINYLHATGCRLALMINFGSKGRLEWKRVVV